MFSKKIQQISEALSSSRGLESIQSSERVPTGIPGFDNLIGGGYLRRSVNLISGNAGCGKTAFCLQFLYNGATKYNENGLYISFEEDLDDLREDAKNFGIGFDQLEKDKKVSFIYLFPYELDNFQDQLVKHIATIGAKRVIIDSTSTFGMSLESSYEVRRMLYSMMTQLRKLDCTTILTSEVVDVGYDPSRGAGSLSRFGVEEFVADSVISLYYSGLGGASDRALRIVKMRRTNHAKEPIAFALTSQGFAISERTF